VRFSKSVLRIKAVTSKKKPKDLPVIPHAPQKNSRRASGFSAVWKNGAQPYQMQAKIAAFVKIQIIKI
jgi:hypothetical protein